VNPSLQGYAAAVLDAEAPDSLGGLAVELESVDELVDSNNQLRSALTDTAVPAASRRAVIDELLRGKVSEAARRTAAFAAGAVSAPDVPLAFNWLSIRARHVAEGAAPPEPTLGHLEARERVAGFAAAVYENLGVSELDELEDELFRFARTVEGAPALRGVLSDRDIELDARHAIVAQLLEGKVSPAAVALVQYTLTGGRSRDFVGTLDYLVVQTATARGWRVARVRAAREVDADESAKLSQSLSALTGSPVELQVSLDPDLLSGVLVDIGDLRVDATTRGRLDALRDHLLTHAWDEGPLAQGDEAPETSGSETSGSETSGSQPSGSDDGSSHPEEGAQ
jgi:F-type H+-transporting ATPase subunit delta